MASNESKLIVTASGKKPEVDLIVPRTYQAMMNNFRQLKILNGEREKVSLRYTHFDFSFEKKSLQKQPYLMA